MSTITRLPSQEILTARIARCIGIWETNRGGDFPKPKESTLDTVANVHASMATIEQATMPYAVAAFSKYSALRNEARPVLTREEVSAANDCCVNVVSLLQEVENAIQEQFPLKDFLEEQDALIQKTFLGSTGVETMYRAVELRQRIETLRSKVNAGSKTLDQAVASIPETERMGLGRGSLKAYIRKAANWGEHRAGWQRKAVQSMPKSIGSRIEIVATSQDGMRLAIPVIGDRVREQLEKKPIPSEEMLVKRVSKQNNPKEANYASNVYKIYRRLFINPGKRLLKKIQKYIIDTPSALTLNEAFDIALRNINFRLRRLSPNVISILSKNHKFVRKLSNDASVGLSPVEEQDLLQLAHGNGINISAVMRLIQFQRKFEEPFSHRHVAIVDFALHSRNNRLFIFDLVDHKVEGYLCAHGSGSEGKEDGFADVFSNVPNSKASSLGVYKCTDTYVSKKNGLSLRLTGLERTNDNAKRRKIVIHGASYVSFENIRRNGRIGRSSGCPAVENQYARKVIENLKGGTLLIVWHQ